jgi:hypothetical protein
VDVYEVDLLYGGDVERDNGYRTVATKFNSFQVEVQRGRIDSEGGSTAREDRQRGRIDSEGGSTARLIRLSKRDRRVVAESTTIISVWADTIDIVIKTTRESTMCLQGKEAVVATALMGFVGNVSVVKIKQRWHG